MEVKLEKSWPLEVAAAQAWALLSDVPAVAACMPGAQITAQVDATHWKGQMRCKIGPATMVFLGEIELLECEPAVLRLALMGKGADKGGSAATMKLAARLEPTGAAASTLAGDATVTVSGKLAQFGGRLLVPVADAMLAQFAENFRMAAAQRPVPATASATTAPAAASGPEPGPEPGGAPAAAPAFTAPPEPAGDAPVDALEASTARTPAPPSGTVPPKELNVLSLAWTVPRGWVRDLFGRKPA
jgi:hypothetical protein